MFGKIAGFLVGVAKWALALIGLAVVLLAWWVFGGDAKKPEAGPGPAAVQVAPAVAEENSGCECAKGQICTGKRGGRYCLSEEGKKRYLVGP